MPLKFTFFALAFSCSHAGSDSANADNLPAGWTLSEPHPCTSPVPHHYSERGLPVQQYSLPGEDFVGLEPGGLAFIDGESPLLVYAMPEEKLGAINLSNNSFVGGLEEISGLSSFSLADLDENGVSDLVLGGRVLEIWWDYNGAKPEKTTFAPVSGALVRDAVLADWDGDGSTDILATLTPKSEAPDAASVLYTNQGNRAFSAGAALAEPPTGWGRAFDGSAVDLDGDSAPDAVICNDMGDQFGPNVVFTNDDGLDPANPDFGLEWAGACMGIAWADFDGDARLDVAYGDAGGLKLFFQDESEKFYDASLSSGFTLESAEQMLWGLAAVDLNLDGYTDLVMPSSWFWASTAEPWPVYALLQTDEGWEEAHERLGLPTETGARSVVSSDLNDDGVVDFILGDGWRSPRIFESDGCVENHFFEVEAPEGTVVTVEAGGRVQVARVSQDSSFASAGPARITFGLGQHDVIEHISVAVPWRDVVRFDSPIGVDRRLIVR